tara:strand:+ start:1414 stop:2286 length:873 start_codon:yes stop_codon:yes gene_type:complete
MGIKHLRKIISAAMRKVSVKELAGKRVGLDTSLMVYQLHQNHVASSHLRGVFNRIIAYWRHGICPVFFFDGKPPDLKAGVCAQRKKREEKASAIKIPPGTFDDIRELLRLMRVEYIDAPGEAEAQGAHATTVGYIDILATEDIDALPFGAVQQCLGLNASTREVTLVGLAETLGVLNMNRLQFVELCVLLGSDYTTKTLPGIGPKRALENMKKHGSIAKIIAELKIVVPAEFCYEAAVQEFLNPRVLTEYPEKSQRPVYTEEETEAIGKFLLSKNINSGTASLSTAGFSQ